MNKLVQTFERIKKACDKFISAIISILLLVMVVSIATQVCYRYVLETSISWTEELARYSCISMVFLGAALCTSRNAHINLDFLSQAIKKEKVNKIITVVCDFITLAIDVILIKWSLGYLSYMIETSATTTVMHVPYAIPVCTMPICFVLTALFLVMRIISTLVTLNVVPDNGEGKE